MKILMMIIGLLAIASFYSCNSSEMEAINTWQAPPGSIDSTSKSTQGVWGSMKEKTDSAVYDTSLDVETLSDSAFKIATAKTTVSFTPETKVVQELPAMPDIKYPKAVKRTLFEIVHKAFPSLSNDAKDIIADNLYNNRYVLVTVNANIEAVVDAKVRELSKLGFIVTIDPESPINLSNRFKYVAYDGRDSTIRLTQKWERKSKSH